MTHQPNNTMTMRERIARALMREASHDPVADKWCSPTPWLGAADAVLAAMREPTEKMVLDMTDCWHDQEIKALDEQLIEVWQAAIDAAKDGA